MHPHDTDSDGMPDLFELQYGFSVTDPLDGLLDFDEDGISNLDEYLKGTDPTVKDPKDENGSFPFILIIIIATFVVLLGIVISIIVIVNRSKNEEPMMTFRRDSIQINCDYEDN